MINFINKGSDEALLKSLQANPGVDQEELQKAIDKSKLVQVETTVQGKNKTFTRKQWKKAGDVKSTDRVIGGQQPTKEDNKPKLNDKTVKVKPEDIKIGDYVKVSNNEGAGGIISVQKVTEINKSTLRGITVYHFNHSSKMRFAGRAGSSTIEKYVVEDSATTTKNADDKSKPKDDGDKPIQSKYKVGDKGMITTKGGTTIPVKVIGVTMNYKDEVVYEVRENRVLSGNHSPQDYRVTEKGFKPLQNNSKAGGNTDSSKSPVSSMPDSIGSLKKDSYSGETWYEGTMGGHRVRILQEDAGKSDWWNIEVDGKLVRTDNNKAMAFQSVKDAHDELKEQTSKQSNGPKVLDSADGFKTGQEVMYNDHKVKIEKITEGYGGKALFDVSKDGTRMAMTLESKDLKPVDKQPTTSQKANYFKAEPATKNKVNDLSKQMGNDKLIQFAKDNGVTWKEHDHKAINIMRMKMALAQAIQEGKITDNKSTMDSDKISGNTESSNRSSKSSDMLEGEKVKDIPLQDNEDVRELMKIHKLVSSSNDISQINEQLKSYADKNGITSNGGKIEIDEKGRVFVRTSDGESHKIFKKNLHGKGGDIFSERAAGNFMTSRGKTFDDKAVLSLQKQGKYNEDGSPKKHKIMSEKDNPSQVSADGKVLKVMYPEGTTWSGKEQFSAKISKKVPNSLNVSYEGDLKSNGKTYMMFASSTTGKWTAVEIKGDTNHE